MASADGSTFAGLLGILTSLKSMQLLTVRKQMVEVIETKAGVNKPSAEFDKIAVISTFYLCTQQAVPFFSVSNLEFSQLKGLGCNFTVHTSDDFETIRNVCCRRMSALTNS